MRSQTEVDAEIVALKKALTLGGVHHGSRWSASTRTMLQETIKVLEQNTSAVDIEAEHYMDETCAEYVEGDNELYHELMRVRHWLDGDEEGYEAPSLRL